MLLSNIEVTLKQTAVTSLNPEWNNKKVLITEDDEISFKLIEIILSRTNVNILRAVTGREAVELAHANPGLDLILMDLQLPVMDGYEAIRRIRVKNKSVPIIVQSAHAMVEEIEKAFQAGCNDFVSKPISDKVLLLKMERYLHD